MSPDFRCPVCSTSLSPNARSCGHCGAQREGASWLTPKPHDELDLDDDTFDYDDFVRREFGNGRPDWAWFERMNGKERFWWVVAVIVFAAFVAMAVASEKNFP